MPPSPRKTAFKPMGYGCPGRISRCLLSGVIVRRFDTNPEALALCDALAERRHLHLESTLGDP
ncbi:MAG: hypothetical protein ABSB35_35370, partial [Bryobacteraceae bacterium]